MIDVGLTIAMFMAAFMVLTVATMMMVLCTYLWWVAIMWVVERVKAVYWRTR
jgi:hypothetical protein